MVCLKTRILAREVCPRGLMARSLSRGQYPGFASRRRWKVDPRKVKSRSKYSGRYKPISGITSKHNTSFSTFPNPNMDAFSEADNPMNVIFSSIYQDMYGTTTHTFPLVPASSLFPAFHMELPETNVCVAVEGTSRSMEWRSTS